MSTTAATHALRTCLRRKSTIAVCRRNVAPSRYTSVASSICPTRRLSSATRSPPHPSQSSPPAPRPNVPRTHPTTPSSRPYSSSTQGTIGAGEAGREQDAARETEAPSHLNEKEKEIWAMLQRELNPAKLEVQDVSGGCGSMYAIEVASERFRGLSMLKQQRLVNEVLGEEIKGWHGVQLRTSVP